MISNRIFYMWFILKPFLVPEKYKIKKDNLNSFNEGREHFVHICTHMRTCLLKPLDPSPSLHFFLS